MILNIQSRTLLLMLYSLACGIALGVFYDATHTLPRGVQSPYRRSAKILILILQGFFDVLFCVLISILSMLLSYYCGGGFFRAITFVLMLGGFVAFKYTLGVLWRRLLSYVYGVLWRITRSFLRTVLAPIKLLCSKLTHIYRLTKDKILGKIKERRDARAMSTPTPEITEEGEKVYVAKGFGYRKQGRISIHVTRRQ